MKTTRFFTILCAAALLRTLPAEAQQTRTMTLHDCMEYAVSNSTKMRIRKAAADDARISRRDAVLAAFTPRLDASTYAYYNFGRSIDPQTNTYFTQTSFHNNYGVGLGFELFDGFQAVNNLKISKTGLLISQSEEQQAEADICLAVMEAYYNVVYYKRLSDVCAEQVAAAESSLHKARRQEELGRKGYADVVQMEAELADRRYELTNTRNLCNDQLMTLADLMFWPLDEELHIDTSMPAAEAGSPASDSVVEYALDHNPSLLIAGWNVDNARRELSTAKWQLLPSLGLYAGWNTSYYTYQGARTDIFGAQFRNNGGEYVQLSLSVPIFGRLQGHSKIVRKRNALNRATAELDQTRRDVESEVRRAIQDRDGAASAYAVAQRRAEVQNEAYSLNLRKLEQGLISPLEFQTANGNYLKSKADEMNSLFRYLIKQAVVKYYGGQNYLEQ